MKIAGIWQSCHINETQMTLVNNIRVRITSRKKSDNPPAVRLLPMIIVAVMLISLATMGCQGGGGAGDELRLGVVDSLTQINNTAIGNIDAELAKIDQEMDTATEQFLDLNQVVAPALEWVNLQKAKAKERGNNLSVKVADDGLAQLKNKRYQITALEMDARDVGTSKEKVDVKITIADLNEKTKQDWKQLDTDLQNRLSALMQKWAAKSADRTKSSSAMVDVLANWEKWQIKKINDTNYTVSGPGLGWLNKQLSTGNWNYDSALAKITPSDAPAAALKKILSAEF